MCTAKDCLRVRNARMQKEAFDKAKLITIPQIFIELFNNRCTWLVAEITMSYLW